MNKKLALQYFEKIGTQKYKIEILLKDTFALHKLKSPQELLGNSIKSLKWLIHTCFFRGRRDELSLLYADCAMKSIDEILYNKTKNHLSLMISNNNRFIRLYKEYVEQIKKKNSNERFTYNQKDIEMLLSLVNDYFIKIVNLKEENIIRYFINKIKEGKLWHIYYEIIFSQQITDKIPSFILRDIVDLFDLQEYLTDQDYLLLQPVDTWVEQGVRYIWKPAKKDKQLYKYILVSESLKYNISPIHVNQGIWYEGYSCRGFQELNNHIKA